MNNCYNMWMFQNSFFLAFLLCNFVQIPSKVKIRGCSSFCLGDFSTDCRLYRIKILSVSLTHVYNEYLPFCRLMSANLCEKSWCCEIGISTFTLEIIRLSLEKLSHYPKDTQFIYSHQNSNLSQLRQSVMFLHHCWFISCPWLIVY